jgi:anti-sigma factor RsiW
MDRGAEADLTCHELIELVTDYLEDALPAHERARFEAHLGECEGCVAYVEQMRTTIAFTRAAGAAGTAPGIDALLEAFRGYRRRL